MMLKVSHKFLFKVEKKSIKFLFVFKPNLNTSFSKYAVIDTATFLFCIFPVLTTDPYHKFKIKIATEEFNAEDESNGLCCNLVFAYTEKYPDTAPIVEIEDTINFEDDQETGLLAHVHETVNNIF